MFTELATVQAMIAKPVLPLHVPPMHSFKYIIDKSNNTSKTDVAPLVTLKGSKDKFNKDQEKEHLRKT